MQRFKKLVQVLLLIICLSVFCYSGYRLYLIYHGYSQADRVYQDVTNQYVTPMTQLQEDETQPSEAPKIKEYAPIQIDFDALLQDSPDVVGWIYCADTVINYPIVHGEDNEFYLRHLADKTYNFSGSIFMDYRCSGEFNGFNTLIYGHNMRNGSMFSVLEKYRDPEFREAHPVMYLLTPEQDYRMDILAGVLTDGDSPLYMLPGNEEEFRRFLEKFRDKADFTMEQELSGVEKTVCLSTCAYDFDEARYLVLGSLVPLDRKQDNP